jgi:hypothetical protein
MAGDMPELETTPELLAALDALDEIGSIFLGFGVAEESFREIVAAVRLVDAETVGAIHARRVREMGPHYPESFQAEEDGLEAAEQRLRAPMPARRDLEPLPVVHMVPPVGSSLTLCCGRVPFELVGDQLTREEKYVNCPGGVA